MAMLMSQHDQAPEAIEAIKSLRHRCTDQSQESLDNILLRLYRKCGRWNEQIQFLRNKLRLIQQGVAFNGKHRRSTRSQRRKLQISMDEEESGLLANLGWALMQINNYSEAETVYRRSLWKVADDNGMCNLSICLMKQGRIAEAKQVFDKVKPALSGGSDSHIDAYKRAEQMLKEELLVKDSARNKSGRSENTNPRLCPPCGEWWGKLLSPNNKDFEDAAIDAVLRLDGISKKMTEKRLKGLHVRPSECNDYDDAIIAAALGLDVICEKMEEKGLKGLHITPSECNDYDDAVIAAALGLDGICQKMKERRLKRLHISYTRCN